MSFITTVRCYIADSKKYYRDPLYRNSIALILSNVSLSAFGLLYWVVAARTMQSEVVGLATAILSVATLIVYISRFGLDFGLVRYFPLSSQKRELNNTVTLITLLASLGFAGVFLIGLQVFSPPLLLLRQGPLLFQFAANVAITSVLTTQMYVLIALRRSDLFLLQCLVLGLRVPLLLLVAPLGVLGVLISVNVASLFPLLLGVAVLYRHKLPLRLEVPKGLLREIIAFSLGNYTATILSQLPTTVIPVMVINTAGATASAYFYISYNIAGIAWMVPISISMSFLVEGSHNLPTRELALKSLKFASLLAGPLMVFMLLFGNQLLLVFGPQYAEQSAVLFRLLVVATIFVIPISIYISIERIHKKTRMINFVYLAIAILVIGVGYVGLLAYGVIGVGYAWVVAYAAVCAATGWLAISREKWVSLRRAKGESNNTPKSDKE